MKKFKLFYVFLLLSLFSFKQGANSDQLKAIIEKFETERKYDFGLNESVENTMKYYQAEADFSRKLKKELELISTEGLSESEIISRELLLFVLKVMFPIRLNSK